MTPDEKKELDASLEARFKELPKVLQDAITSSDVEANLRQLSQTHKLHIDQWAILENEVQMALLGFQPVENLSVNLAHELNLPAEAAANLATDISSVIFEPIRAELERELDHPEAKREEKSGTDQLRDQMLAEKPTSTAVSTSAAAPAPVQTPISGPSTLIAPATPPKPASEAVPIARVPVSETYKTGETSAARKTVHDDPYRETPV